MCELLGMVASHPADMVFSFTGLALRGGQTGPHADGWGLSLYDGNFARTFLEHHPAFSSPLARFLRENPILTQLAIAHIRKMTRGVASIQNTHPFLRVWHNRHMVFAHNGTLPIVKERPLRYESTLGDTDSEYTFCVMLETLRESYGSRYPDDPKELGKTLFEIANELGKDGMLNFLLADGEHLFARCGDSLYWTERRVAEQQATLVDAELRVRLGDILGPADDARMAVVATAPLTRDETWHKAESGTLWVFTKGDLTHTFEPAPGHREGSSVAPPWQPG
ncbi:MAG: yafJ [Myxococcaceae bacterium]|nr:yafJ [Myxococcaceae bacterium]